jgi:hypothetical protein
MKGNEVKLFAEVETDLHEILANIKISRKMA